MGNLHNNQLGFSVVGGVLLLVIVGIIGSTGYFVWHVQQNTNKNLTSDNSSTPSYSKKTAKKSVTPTSSTQTQTNPNQKILDIKEWGVKVSYTGDDTLSYVVTAGGNGNNISVISAGLAKDYGCDTEGAGQVTRISSANMSKDIYGSYTYTQDYQAHPNNYGHVGDYYFQFIHDQGWCGNSNPTDAAVSAQNSANALTKSLVSKFAAE